MRQAGTAAPLIDTSHPQLLAGLLRRVGWCNKLNARPITAPRPIPRLLRGRNDLRIGGDPLHLPLLQAAASPQPLQLAFRSPADWAARLRRDRVDVALVSVAGLAERAATVLPPTLGHHQEAGVELLPIGRRPLVLLQHAKHRSVADRQLTGWLLPPRHHLPLLHDQLSQQALMPLHPFAAKTPRAWLARLHRQPLLLPTHLTLLTLPGWRDAPLRCLHPPTPLLESLWLLVRRQDLERPDVLQLLDWWGGLRLLR